MNIRAARSSVHRVGPHWNISQQQFGGLPWKVHVFMISTRWIIYFKLTPWGWVWNVSKTVGRLDIIWGSDVHVPFKKNSSNYYPLTLLPHQFLIFIHSFGLMTNQVQLYYERPTVLNALSTYVHSEILWKHWYKTVGLIINITWLVNIISQSGNHILISGRDIAAELGFFVCLFVCLLFFSFFK